MSNEITSTTEMAESEWDGHSEPSDVQTDMTATTKPEGGIEFYVQMRDYTKRDMEELISEDDARAEGHEPTTCANVPAPKDGFPSWRSAFAFMWSGRHGPGSWYANPWCAAVTFRPHLINVDEFLRQREGGR